MLSDQSYHSLGIFLLLNTLSSQELFGALKKQLIKLHSQKSRMSEREIETALFKFLTKKVIQYKSQASLKEFKHESELLLTDDSLLKPEVWYLQYQSISPKERVTLILSLVLGKNDQQVADILSVSEGTVRYRVSSCLLNIAKAF